MTTEEHEAKLDKISLMDRENAYIMAIMDMQEVLGDVLDGHPERTKFIVEINNRMIHNEQVRKATNFR